jgi:sigma-54 dependent transcriptional regulator, acetoin dehydrogenase operon transcriptional activator AcoR
MTDAPSQPMLVEQARELFFMQGLDPEERIAPHISRSWQRSRPVARDVAAPTPMALAHLTERREQAMRLLQCAQPELDGLAEHAVGNGCVVILTDASGLILDEIGSPDFLPKAERIALTPGVEWSEGSRGTNAIGTALAEREALMVLGREHYLPQNGAIGCAAAPIFTGRGEVAGVLDISGEAVRVNPHALGLVRMAAQQVEHRMLLADASGHVLRFHRRPGLLGTAREAVLVIDDGHVVAANRVALAMLGLSWDALLDQRVEPLIGKQWGRVEHQRGLLTLPGGQQIAATMDRFAGATASQRSVARTARINSPDAPEADDVLPLLTRAVRVLNEGVPVLVSGETGSGKEVFARRLHASSRRHAGPFVAVNCAALPESLIEAELFGYDEGAFTGARKRGVPGRIREAHGGVLFLDEIADMPLAMQTRLLRVLEERVVTPLGGGPAVAVDFDLVCATHGDLAALAAQQRFRSDLLYRVAGFAVTLPALRDRADRVALITRLFMECGGAAKTLRLDEAALAQLAGYRWPGNVRELRSVLKSVTALAEPGDCISADQLPEALRCTPIGAVDDRRAGIAAVGDGIAPEALEDIERHSIDAALAACKQNVTAAARQLGVHRSTVYRHLAGRRTGT